MSLFRRLLGFGVAPLLTVTVPSLALPPVTRSLTSVEWVALAVGQAAGTIVSIIVAFGCSLSGVVLIRGPSAEGRRRLWKEFLLGSTLLLLLASVLAGPIVWLTVAEEARLYAFCVLLGAGIGGLSLAGTQLVPVVYE